MMTAPTCLAGQGLFEGYTAGPFYDEMFASQGRARSHYERVFGRFSSMAPAQFGERRKLADLSFLLQGITFTVYNDGRGTERLFPFDLVPRILPQSEWAHIERGLTQRVIALNLFLQDLYGKQLILKDRKIPTALVYSCRHFRREMIGLEVPHGIYTHICGIDLVRDSETGEFFVLEDNVRTPSGISYVLENRLVMTRTFPEAFQEHEVLPVNNYPSELSRILRTLSPRGEARSPNCSAHSRHPQQRVFRAQLPRAADGHRTGRGARLDRRWRRGLHEDHLRPQACRRHLPPRR